jgi:DNA primase
MTDTQTIKDRISIVQLIQEYVPLKKSGANWKGNCPFHNEKSPSFMVHEDKQIYHCFGCGKGGDIFAFIQEIEGVDFPEALKLLATRAGVQLDTFKSDVNRSQRNRLLEIHSKAALFFHRILLELPQAKPARDYVARRGLDRAGLELWNIGYAPEQWDLLTKYLVSKGFSRDDLVASGLTIRREDADPESGRGYYDRFRGRVMFPLSDVQGAVVGFTGRVLIETEKSGGKYVNSPQTLIYDKSRLLFGLSKAKSAIKSEGFAVIVEGQMDVIACHRAGMTNVVAASGTALTSEQLKLLKRYTTRLCISFDADSAGVMADKRGIDAAVEAGMEVKIVTIPEGAGKDADECIAKNKAVWFKAVEQAKGVMEWYFEMAFKGGSTATAQGKQAIADILMPQIAKIPYPVERDHWLKDLAARLQTDPGVLVEEMRRTQANPVRKMSATALKPVEKVPPIALKPERQEILLKLIWSLLSVYPDHFGVLRDQFKREYAEASSYRDLYDLFEKHYTTVEAAPGGLFEAYRPTDPSLSLEVLQLNAEREYPGIKRDDALKELQHLIVVLREVVVKRQRRELQYRIELAEKTKDTEQLNELLSQLQKLR